MKINRKKSISKDELILAKVGLIALVDEATGYQYKRDKKALQEKLEEFVRKDKTAIDRTR